MAKKTSYSKLSLTPELRINEFDLLIVDKCEKVENKIYRLNKKYTYSKKIKVKNPYYKEKEVIAI